MYTGIFDTHAHYDHEAFNYLRHATLSSMPDLGVSLILNCGSDEDSSAFSAELSEKYPFVYAAAGIHPHEAAAAAAGWEERLLPLLRAEKTVAVGEIGLDYHYNFSEPKTQREIFARSLELAVSLDMPVIIHDREAHGDVLAMLSEYRPRGVVHRFSGTPEMAGRLLALGFYLGFGGAVTYENAKDERESLKELPIGRLLLETDCPFLSPRQKRGELCRSDMISYAAETISEIRPEYTPEQIILAACENGRRLFSIP